MVEYSLDRDFNVFLAKKYFVEQVYSLTILEKISITWFDAYAICNNVPVDNIKPNTMYDVINIQNAYKDLINYIDAETSFELLCIFNQSLGSGNTIFEAGNVRRHPVRIGMTSYTPSIPDKEEIMMNFKNILGNASDSETDRALKLFLYLCRVQAFNDGNKRSAYLIANHYLITHGRGYLIFSENETCRDFIKLLVVYYETEAYEDIMKFMKDKLLFDY